MKVFTITPGRSGSHYLKKIIGRLTPLRPDHVERFPESPSPPWDPDQTVAAVWNDLPDPYFSTSLIPKNGYLMALAAKGAKFVYLHRDAISIAHSWYQIGDIPGRSRPHHPDPYAKTNCLLVTSALTEFELCLWLAMEVGSRADFINAMFGAGTVRYESTERLNDAGAVRQLFQWIGVDGAIDPEIVGTRINTIDAIGSIKELQPGLPAAAQLEAASLIWAKLDYNDTEKVRI